jgi:hypothetical protein
MYEYILFSIAIPWFSGAAGAGFVIAVLLLWEEEK